MYTKLYIHTVIKTSRKKSETVDNHTLRRGNLVILYFGTDRSGYKYLTVYIGSSHFPIYFIVSLKYQLRFQLSLSILLCKHIICIESFRKLYTYLEIIWYKREKNKAYSCDIYLLDCCSTSLIFVNYAIKSYCRT